MTDSFLNRRHLLAGAAVTGLSACAAAPRLPNVGSLYQYVSDIDPADRRPLITIPGFLGSRLAVKDGGGFVWGGDRRISVDPDRDEGARLLALPIGRGDEPLNALRDDVRPAGVLRKAHARALFAILQQDVYSNLANALNSGGYEFSQTIEAERARRGENPGSLEFPYDWRRDIVESAQELDRFVDRKAEQVERVRRERYGASRPAEKIRFDFIAHSMGGLVLRYWLMYGAQDLPSDGSLPELTWAGASKAACVIFIAPPNLGSIAAFRDLLDGRTLGPFQPHYRKGLLGTLPSLYQLMPRDRHNRVRIGVDERANIFDPAVWRANRWGLLDPDEDDLLSVLMPDAPSRAERERRAVAHLRKVLARAERLHAALDVTGAPPATDLFLVVGTGLDTPASAVVDPKTRTARIVANEEGDGVVLRASALRSEDQGGHIGDGPRQPIRYRTTLLLPGEHVEITANPVFADNLLHWLLDQPRSRSPYG